MVKRVVTVLLTDIIIFNKQLETLEQHKQLLFPQLCEQRYSTYECCASKKSTVAD